MEQSRCPCCGNLLPFGANVCSYCGRKLTYCGRCGCASEESSAFCMRCGARLRGGTCEEVKPPRQEAGKPQAEAPKCAYRDGVELYRAWEQDAPWKMTLKVLSLILFCVIIGLAIYFIVTQKRIAESVLQMEEGLRKTKWLLIAMGGIGFVAVVMETNYYEWASIGKWIAARRISASAFYHQKKSAAAGEKLGGAAAARREAKEDSVKIGFYWAAHPEKRRQAFWRYVFTTLLWTAVIVLVCLNFYWLQEKNLLDTLFLSYRGPDPDIYLFCAVGVAVFAIVLTIACNVSRKKKVEAWADSL